jgi:uncharacterized sodium:solute symporter family permease YidK
MILYQLQRLYSVEKEMKGFIIILLFVCLFICGLFNDAVSSSDYIESNMAINPLKSSGNYRLCTICFNNR